MPENSRSTKPSKKVSKKAAKKATRKVAKKAARKVAAKGAKKAARKVAKKGAKKGARKVAKKAAKKGTRKRAGRSQGSRRKVVEVSAETRHAMIAEAAYHRAEKRNFQDGDPVADWLSGEKEIDVLLSKAGL